MTHGQDHGVGLFQASGQILVDPELLQLVLVPEKPRPRIPRRGVGVLLFEFPPVFHVGVVDGDLGPHLGKLPDHDLRTAVPGVPHVLPVGSPEDGDLRGRHDPPHVPQGVPDELGRVERPGVVDVDGQRRHPENVVVEAHERVVGPHPEPPVLGQAVAADPRAGEDHVGMGGPDPDRLDHLDEVHPVSLGEEAPFVKVGENRRPVRVLHDFAGLALQGPVEDGEGEFFHVQNFREKSNHPLLRFLVNAAAHPPEVPDGRNVIPAGHDPLEGVGDEGLPGDSPPFEGFLDDRVGHVLRRPRGDRRFDEDETARFDLFPDDPERLFQGPDLGTSLHHVPQGLFQVVALDIHHDHVGQFQDIVSVGGREGLLLRHAPPDHGGHLGVLRLHRGDPLFDPGDLPVRPGGGPLHSDDELLRFPRMPVRRIGHHRRHDGADEADAHDDDDLPAPGPLFVDRLLETVEFCFVVFRPGKGENFAVRCYGEFDTVFLHVADDGFPVFQYGHDSIPFCTFFSSGRRKRLKRRQWKTMLRVSKSGFRAKLRFLGYIPPAGTPLRFSLFRSFSDRPPILLCPPPNRVKTAGPRTGCSDIYINSTVLSKP